MCDDEEKEKKDMWEKRRRKKRREKENFAMLHVQVYVKTCSQYDAGTSIASHVSR